MRWIDRGPEPDGVAGYAQQFTQGWVDYFQNRVGERPTDHYWGEFRSALGSWSNNICWYCERQCDGEGELDPTVDNFRPRSRFPELVYAWSNWIFSCYRCNYAKLDKWPETGYVDPCAEDPSERPEQYFDYNVVTGEIIPREGLSETARRKALNTIDDLDLNNLGLLEARLERTKEFYELLQKTPASERQAVIDQHVDRPVEHAGVIRMFVENLRRDGVI